ncbi:hypothetical protein Tco_0910492 [Tanacetum coccineum]|uniref:Uncharacterized protein n=1 Tax=Tanacetum coccineum TaxID=301880 RepID=A0ABQ5CUR8_9ASTR
MGDEVISNIPARETDEFIKSSVDDLVPILREPEVTSDSDLKCDMPATTTHLLSTDVDVREENFDINSPLGEYEFEDISSLDLPESTPVIDENLSFLSHQHSCSNNLLKGSGKDMICFFSLTQSRGTTRVDVDPLLCFHHMPSHVYDAYSPKVMISYDLEDLHACFQSSNHAVSDHLLCYNSEILKS